MRIPLTSYFISLCLVLPVIGNAQMNAKYAAQVGGIWSGPIKRGAFLAQPGVGAYQKITEGHWQRISVDSFTLLVFRDSTTMFSFKNKGNLFTKDLVLLTANID